MKKSNVGVNVRDNLAQRFWSQVSYGAPGECWLWTGKLDLPRRRGRIMFNARREYAPRVALMLAKPSMFDSKLRVLHTCDNPACCRPGHLFQGTQADNVHDMIRKGRAVNLRGRAHGRWRHGKYARYE